MNSCDGPLYTSREWEEDNEEMQIMYPCDVVLILP